MIVIVLSHCFGIGCYVEVICYNRSLEWVPCGTLQAFALLHGPCIIFLRLP